MMTAGGLLSGGMAAVLSQDKSPQIITNPFFLFGVVAVVCGFIVFLVGITRQHLTGRSENVTVQPPVPPQSVNVTSHNQSGGINAHTVTVHTPQPSVRVDVAPSTQIAADGSYLTEARVLLASTNAIAGLTVAIRGGSIVNFRMNPVYSAMNVFGNTAEPTDGPPWTKVVRTWSAPVDQAYDVQVWTAMAEDIQIEATII